MTGLPAPRGRRTFALSLCLPARLPCAATGSFGLTCRTATGTTEPSVRCVLYTFIYFPYNVTDARIVYVYVSTPRSSCFHELNHDIMNYFAASVAGPESTPVIAQSDR